MSGSMARQIVYALRSLIGTNGLSQRIGGLETLTREALAKTQQPCEAAAPGTLLLADPVAQADETSPDRSLDINYLLHHSRGALLRTMPPGARRLLSACCSGTWYFDWIEATYGRVPEHLGIEFYSPKPQDLPPNVRWIANTASDMSAVETASCDLVFSGQNLEHLWPAEVSGFLLEAARVLEVGGHLVVDSPNRLITAPLNWSHPEHTIELTYSEVVDLMRLAGFDISASHGIWLCRDARDGKILTFDPKIPQPDWSVTERLILARDRPEDSFIWWIEGVRSARVPDAEATQALMNQIFQQHWPERVQRFLVPASCSLHIDEEGQWIDLAPGEGGFAFYGPYIPLRAGDYRITWKIKPTLGAAAPVAILDIVAEGHAEPLARHEVLATETEISLSFTLLKTTFGLQFRCLSTGGAGFSVLRRVFIDENIKHQSDY